MASTKLEGGMQAQSHPGRGATVMARHITKPRLPAVSWSDEATIISLFAESASPSSSSRKPPLGSAIVLLSQRKEGKLIYDVGIFSLKKNFCKAVTDPHSLFCFIVIAIVFSF
jgi:hypothetical protein